ncbi:MAG: hypothetical protein KDI39_12345 [Pseudomonadales bacterium]|nr:hypothetical protein [Pseudomonadales bacterium]
MSSAMAFFIDNYSQLLAMNAAKCTQLDELYNQVGISVAVTPYIYQQAILAIRNEKLHQEALFSLSSSFLAKYPVVLKTICNVGGFPSFISKLVFNIGFGYNFRKNFNQTQNFYNDYGNNLNKNNDTYIEDLAYVTTVFCVQLSDRNLEVDEFYPKTLEYVSYVFNYVQSSMQRKK